MTVTRPKANTPVEHHDPRVAVASSSAGRRGIIEYIVAVLRGPGSTQRVLWLVREGFNL
jgi:hypothetical protein